MQGKRGILIKEAIYIVLAILIIAIIFPALVNVYNTVLTTKEKAQAQGSIERLGFALDDSTAEEASNFLGYVPQDWWLVAFSKDSAIPECFSESCVCICEEEDCGDERYCKIIGKDLLETNSGEPVKTKFISSLIITSQESFFNTVVRYYPENYKPFELSSGTSVDNYFKVNAPALEGTGGAIIEAASQSQIPVAFIMAVAMHESGKGTSRLAQEVCPEGSSKFSNNLFGITGVGNAGSCIWETRECFTKGEADKSTFEVLGTDDCDVDCKDKTCYRVKRPFRAYYDKGESIKDFSDRISQNSRYKSAIEDFKGDLYQLAESIGKERIVNGEKLGGYATDPGWSAKVASLASKITKEVV